jgi:hypothetical protein
VNAKIFYRAINMLKEMGEDKTREHQGETKKTRVIVRDLQNEMTKRKERSPMTNDGKGEVKGQMADTKEAKKYKNNEAGEESDISENAATEIKKAGELARHSDMKKEDDMKDKDKKAKEMEVLRMKEERQDKEKRDTLYREMIQSTKEEADRLVTKLHKKKIEAYQKDVFELNETMSPWVTEMTMD